ncbi:Uu.00g025080.m01.CDS01 [Anthostomella pinea]|uniref:Uu.00g025080.m01.CDS01 n=1 Tax=Anthostomella pinea TaxID=933095 RepID=A0AAI8V7A5_9PEZI|nr:Uu.00g025080.m01.CDS01 [Anthostomella pinea]
MLFAVFFAFWRFLQIVTLIPTMGMLAYFVHGWVELNQLTPDYVLVLFIVSVLALAWSIYTLFSYHRSSTNATFVAIFDLLFVGAFIGAVYALRFIANANCSNVTRGSNTDISFGPYGYASVADWDINVDKTCAMLKACFAFGIMNAVFFFITSILACFHGDRMSDRDQKTYYRETHVHRHGHRSSRSPHSRRSRSHSHSHRRTYV